MLPTARIELGMALLHNQAFLHTEVARLLIESRCAFCGARVGVSLNAGLLAFIEASHSCPIYLEFLNEELPPPRGSQIRMSEGQAG